MGPLSGKLGSLIGSSWKGVGYIKMNNYEQATKKTWSVAQIASREKFKFLRKWLVPLQPYVNIGFRNLAKECTEINVAFKENFRNAMIGEFPNFDIDYTKVVLSIGILAGATNPTASYLNSETLEISWINSYTGKSSFDDQLMLIIYCPFLTEADGFIGGTKRAVKRCVHPIPNQFIGQSLHIYMSFISINGKLVSNSQYLGKIEPYENAAQ